METRGLEKVIIPLSKCIPGMVLLQSVLDVDTGNIIINKDQELTQGIIEGIGKFKHTQVWVGIRTEQSIWQVEDVVIKNYKQYASMLKRIMAVDKKGEAIKIEELIDLSDCIIEDFKSNFNLIACVHSLKDIKKDGYEHSINVAFLSLLIGRWQEYSPEKLKQLVLAALLHDIGKLDVFDNIHNNESSYNIKQIIEYKRHPIYGYEKLSKEDNLDLEVLKAVLTHHERCDGSGFPLHLTEEHISDLAKIIGLADEYDNLRGQEHIFKVIKTLRCTRVRKFDINILLEFCANIINYFIGNFVLLSTGETGEIVFIQEQHLHRPIVRVKNRYINLYDNPQIEIIKVF